MPIVEEREEAPAEGDDYQPGQAAYEALRAVLVDADELALMGLLAALQRGASWAEVAPTQRRLCEALEGELFEGDEP